MSHLGAEAGIDLNPNNAALNQNNLVLKIENLKDDYTAQLDTQRSDYTAQLDALRSEIKSL